MKDWKWLISSLSHSPPLWTRNTSLVGVGGSTFEFQTFPLTRRKKGWQLAEETKVTTLWEWKECGVTDRAGLQIQIKDVSVVLKSDHIVLLYHPVRFLPQEQQFVTVLWFRRCEAWLVPTLAARFGQRLHFLCPPTKCTFCLCLTSPKSRQVYL